MSSEWLLWAVAVVASALSGAMVVSLALAGVARIRGAFSGDDGQRNLPPADGRWKPVPLPPAMASDETVGKHVRAMARWTDEIRRWDEETFVTLDRMFPRGSLSWQRVVPVAAEGADRLSILVSGMRVSIMSVRWERHRHLERMHAAGKLTEGDARRRQMEEGRSVLAEMDSFLAEGEALADALGHLADQTAEAMRENRAGDGHRLAEEIERLAGDMSEYAGD